MPRDGSNIYSAPPGTKATPATLIESSKYNAFIDDLVADANAPRPITAGGTGSSAANPTFPRLRLTSTTEATLASTDHAFQIGDAAGSNLIADANEVQSRNNGAAATFSINPAGGDVVLGGAGSVVSAAGTISGTHTGNGSGLTALNAANLSSGTLPSARLSGSYSFTDLTLSGSLTVTGATLIGPLVASAGFIGPHSGNGSALTNLDASNLFSGTVPSLRLFGGSYTFASVGATNVSTSTFNATSSASFSSTVDIAQFSSTGVTAGKSFSNTGGLDSSRDTTSNSSHIRFYNPNGLVGQIVTSASATAYNTSSDERLKENFSDFQAGSIIDRLNVYEYSWKADGTTGYGPKAQELYEVFPQAVAPGNDLEPGEEGFVPWSYDASKLMPLAIRELQSLRLREATLEARVAALEARLGGEAA